MLCYQSYIFVQNRWVPRAIQAQGPKTIDQIHADAKEEKEQIARQAAAAAQAAASNQMKSQVRIKSLIVCCIE